jgi:hypothetical protein
MKPVPIITTDQQNIRAGIIRPRLWLVYWVGRFRGGRHTGTEFFENNTTRDLECYVENVEERYRIWKLQESVIEPELFVFAAENSLPSW